MKTLLTSVATALVLLPNALVLAQGSLTPPGVPVPTMKTLDQVEPRTPIDAIHTPGNINNLYRITVPGSYYLTGPISGVEGKNGISIEASDVTIDLRGFSVTGNPGSFTGVRFTDGNNRLTLRNGTINGWDDDGVSEYAGEGTATEGIYENLHLTGNGGSGMRLGDKCTVRACKFTGNFNYGLFANGRATISRCTASDNGFAGIYFGSGSVLDSVSALNGGSGFESFGEPALMEDCVAFENGDTGFRTVGGAKIADCISRSNSGAGFDASYFSTVTGCTAKNNPWGIFVGGSCHIVGNFCEGNGDGIYAYADRNEIDGNHILNGGTGIKVDPGSVAAKHNLVARNIVGSNATNYNIAADNRVGPTIDITAGGTPAATGNSAADTTTALDPWTNFTY
ncbi:MAG: NosD domain-containing protein [Chthoniobacteraceae bacterium]